jgi:hypothetical protein
VDAQLDERAGVDQQLDPLAGGQLLLRVLGRDLLRAAAELDPLSSRAEVLSQRAEEARRCGVGRVGGRGRK